MKTSFTSFGTVKEMADIMLVGEENCDVFHIYGAKRIAITGEKKSETPYIEKIIYGYEYHLLAINSTRREIKISNLEDKDYKIEWFDAMKDLNIKTTEQACKWIALLKGVVKIEGDINMIEEQVKIKIGMFFVPKGFFVDFDDKNEQLIFKLHIPEKGKCEYYRVGYFNIERTVNLDAYLESLILIVKPLSEKVWEMYEKACVEMNEREFKKRGAKI